MFFCRNKDNQFGIKKKTFAEFNEITHLLLTQREINVDCLDFLFSFSYILYSNIKKPCTIHCKCFQVIKKCLYYTSDQLHYIIE